MKTVKYLLEYTIKDLLLKIKFVMFKVKWKLKNPNNQTVPNVFFPINDVDVGDGTYGELNIYKYNTNSKIYIGNYCSIAKNTSFIIDADHPIDYISTFPYKAMLLHTEKCEAVSKGNIIIDDDVWIGYGAIILSGVHIGQGAVVAAGSVVTKDIPPYAIFGGAPAKLIKYRYKPEMIDALLTIDYSKLNDEIIRKNIDKLYDELRNVEQLEWMPRKEH